MTTAQMKPDAAILKVKPLIHHLPLLASFSLLSHLGTAFLSHLQVCMEKELKNRF